MRKEREGGRGRGRGEGEEREHEHGYTHSSFFLRKPDKGGRTVHTISWERNVGVRYLEIEALAVLQKTPLCWLNNDINLLGEKLARQHEQKKRWNISAK